MPKDESGFALYQLHKSVGITILLLTLARLAWRLTHRPPAAVEGGFQGFLAKAVHTLLYAFMIGGPLTGWAIVSTSRIQVPTMVWGAIPWPHLPLSRALHDVAEEAHELIAWIGIALVVLHVLGALQHQLMLKDGLLRRMAPGGKAWTVFALLALVVATYFGTGMYIASTYLVPAMERAAAREDVARVPLAASPTPTAEATEVAEEEEEATDAAGPPPVWTIQPGGSLGFTVTSGADSYRGRFSDWSGTVVFDPENPETADIRMTINLASASVGDATMDGMLVGAEFLAASANPTATWRSTSVRRTGANRYSASGTLSLKGASKPQSLSFTLSGEGLKRHVEGSANIDRTAFAVGTGESAQGLGNAVALSFAFDAVGREP